MTISVDDTKETFTGDGATVTWPFDFKVDSEADLYVFTTSYEGLDSPLDFTATLNANQNSNPGGTITTDTPVPLGSPGVIMRLMDFTRLNEFDASVPPHIIEAELDRLTMYAQQLREKLDRALHVSAATAEFADMNLRNVPARRNKVIGFDDNGNAVLLSLLGGTVTGPQGVSRVSRVEVSAPAIFRQASNGTWSHSTVDVTFKWIANGSVETSRVMTVSINTGTGVFNAPTPVTGITVSGAGTQLLKLTSSFNNVEDFIQLATIKMADPVFDTGSFAPTWGSGEFSGAPSGNVSWANFEGEIVLKLASALTGTSSTSAMTWQVGSLPVALRPAVARTVPCVLKYNASFMSLGEATFNPDGSASFAPFQLQSGIIAPGVFQTGEAKGLPADWNVVYML